MCRQAERGVMQPQARTAKHGLQHRKPGERWGTDAPSEPWREPAARPLDFRPLVSRTVGKDFCCFKPPSAWGFVTAALGDGHGERGWLSASSVKSPFKYTESTRGVGSQGSEGVDVGHLCAWARACDYPGRGGGWVGNGAELCGLWPGRRVGRGWRRLGSGARS